ncbi:MAG TPA: type II toxin-antitoxin system PemK/MazF family toxin [Thermoanaerobaculia bacterium]|nr:type II toxin-antitoxin system PemK/MazF family toxin [Thermoanaerobaculia bacterium]
MVIRQGDVFWVDLGEASGSASGFLHPHVVVQNDVFNESRLRTVVVCTLTSNLGRARVPGNVLLDEGEANLPKSSVVVVSQLYTVDRDDLVERIGTLGPDRVRQILEGLYLLLEPREVEEAWS